MDSEYLDSENILIFPHTIGNITFRNKDELIEWVENAQKIIQKCNDLVSCIPHK